MGDYLIVDGYNIIGAWPELQRLKEVSLEEARDRLIELLADYQAYSGLTVYIVFDAHQVPGQGGKYVQHQLRIVYTREKETADDVIERLAGELGSRRRKVRVATSDYAQQQLAFGRGALRVSARELWIEVKHSRREMEQRVEEQKQSTRSTFDSRLSREMKHLFEKWRRGE